MTHNQKIAPKTGSNEDRVLDLNCYASALLEAGDYHSAQNALTEALRVLKSVLATSGGGHCQSLSTGPRIACAFATQISATTARPLSPEGSCMVKDREKSVNFLDGSFICRQSVKLYIPQESQQPRRAEKGLETLEFPEGCTLSYAIVYNLALCKHLIGIECAARDSFSCDDDSHETRTNWEQACQLYKHAHQLLTGSGNGIHQDHGHISYLMILNNVGWIQERLGNVSQATRSFNLLFGAIIYYNTTRRIPEDHEQLRAVISGFLSNILPSRPGTYNNAPAA